MPRLTKSDIERVLLTGGVLSWTDANGKQSTLQLTDLRERRLLSFLLSSKVRQPKDLPAAFIVGLASAYDADNDPASNYAAVRQASAEAGPWKLKSIRSENFGGLNTWNGSPFTFDFDTESYTFEGPNGSGKSSLVGAILWTLTGERPRDQSDAEAHVGQPVFSQNDKAIGEWPPIACYPSVSADIRSVPDVKTTLTFLDSKGNVATVERKLSQGVVTTSISPEFEVPAVLIEAGLQMPARLAHLRFDDGADQLTDAVQKLTGLDDLIAIGSLADGLCHKGREYRSFRAKELEASKSEFLQALNRVQSALQSVGVAVPAFRIGDTEDPQGQMAKFGKELNDRAAELATVVSNDLKPGLDLAQTKTQNEIVVAISAARDDVLVGLEGVPFWKDLSDIVLALDGDVSDRLSSAVAQAKKSAAEVFALHVKSQEDNLFQLKASAAKWHAAHEGGPIELCPLCKHDLNDNKTLADELESLQAAGDAAAKEYVDNVNALVVALEEAIPASLRKFSADTISVEPREKIIEQVTGRFILGERYANALVKISEMVQGALATFPAVELPTRQQESALSEPGLEKLRQKVFVAERLVALAAWFSENAGPCKAWWDGLASEEEGEASITTAPPLEARKERLCSHLDRLAEALEKSDPYRRAAMELRAAWKSGQVAAEIEAELIKRNAIAESLSPLKALGPLCEAMARDAINGLSGRIGDLLGQILITEQLQYQQTELNRKVGLVVRAGWSPELKIDATLIANTAWLRAVLWSFVFALREEAVDQLGSDPFPILIFDDPQSTFDDYHRARWAHYIADQQRGSASTQVLIATYDEAFRDLIRSDGIVGRDALIIAPSTVCDRVSVLEGAALDREWERAQSTKTAAAGVEYLKNVRVFVEGLLKLMLRGEDAGVSRMVLGDLRDLLTRLNKAGNTPWNGPPFGTLLSAIRKGSAEIAYIEGANHTTGRNFGMGEASVVQIHWRKHLRPALERAFRTARDHRLLHGGMKALYAFPSTATLPEGYSDKVSTIPLRLLGRAAALSSDRVADGSIDMSQFGEPERKTIRLGKNSAYRLLSPTLEPVARRGDILITRDYGETSSKSLVVALNEDRVLARRYEVTGNHSDVVALTAQAINPRDIAAPIVAHKASVEVRKVIGVLFAYDPFVQQIVGDDEICDCGGEAALTNLTSNALGLVEVDGRSAEPIALDGQYIIVKQPIALHDAVRTLNDKPVIAKDSNGAFYFKRLRAQQSGEIVLESLDSGGDYGPIMLSDKNPLIEVWPVAGVLFEIAS